MVSVERLKEILDRYFEIGVDCYAHNLMCDKLTFTNKDETVLDNCMGSGSTGVACINTNRNFIGIELDENYFNIAKERIKSVEINNCIERKTQT